MPNITAALSADTGAQTSTHESLGWQLRAALPPMRLQSVSLYDAGADVLFLSEGALGPDEHGFVTEALAALGADGTATHRERDFGDGRGAAFLPVRSPQSELVGLVMVLVDAKALIGGNLGTRILGPTVRTLLQRMAILMRPPAATSAPAAPHAPEPAPAPPEPARAVAAPKRSAAMPPPAPAPARPRATPPAAAAERRAAAPLRAAPPPVERRVAGSSTNYTGPERRKANGAPAAPPPPKPVALADPKPAAASADTDLTLLQPRRVDEVLSFELTEDLPTAAEALAVAESQRHGKSGIVLYVQELTKLKPGGRTRRFRVGLRSPDNAEIEHGADADATTTALKALVDGLSARPEKREPEHLSFVIGLSLPALQDEQFPAVIAGELERARLDPASVGFEIPEAACVSHRALMERFRRRCEQLGCFMVLDDFTLDSGALEFLRSKCLRVVRVDPKLTEGAMRDKLAQARVIAIAQATKVLGIHCAAKRVESQNTRRWLSAIGFDLAEGRLFDAPQPLGTLLAAPSHANPA